WYWGLEVMKSSPVGGGKLGVNVRGPRTKLINMIVHNASNSGIGIWSEAPDAEVYGTIVFNNGTERNLDHGIYVQNQTGIKRLTDNVVFHNLAYGVHAYSSGGQYLNNIEMRGN